jgi:hypothetical protein
MRNGPRWEFLERYDSRPKPLLPDIGLDKFREFPQGLLPAEITSIARDHIGNGRRPTTFLSRILRSRSERNILLIGMHLHGAARTSTTARCTVQVWKP